MEVKKTEYFTVSKPLLRLTEYSTRTVKDFEANFDYESFFLDLDLDHFASLTKRWAENDLKIKIPNYDNYDQWLNYFKNLSPSVIKKLAITGVDFLPTEAYAALSRWHDIIKSPHRIDKIHQSGLVSHNKNDKSIIDLARNNDRKGVLEALRDRLAEKLEKGTGARDTASISKEMGEILGQIAELERRSGPKKETKAGKLIGEFQKRSGYNGKGVRTTSFASRVVTIKDKEDEIRQPETQN